MGKKTNEFITEINSKLTLCQTAANSLEVVVVEMRALAIEARESYEAHETRVHELESELGLATGTTSPQLEKKLEPGPEQDATISQIDTNNVRITTRLDTLQREKTQLKGEIRTHGSGLNDKINEFERFVNEKKRTRSAVYKKSVGTAETFIAAARAQVEAINAVYRMN